MNFKIIFLVSALITTSVFTGCSKKSIDEYNKPAIYWYSNIISAIANSDLELADNYYSSLQGEHIASPLLPEATMILALAHMHNEEYLLSEHFSNEYVQRYASLDEKEFSDFMKIKAKYRALPNPRRDQVLIQKALKEGNVFKITYPHSMYIPIVDTMMTNLKMAEAVLNESIAELYIRLDKPKSADYYRNKKAQNWIDWNTIDRASIPFYREMFEGDGTGSWYSFLIPDTQSVVSRNTIQEKYIPQEKEIIADEKPLVTFTQEMADSMYKPYFKGKNIMQKSFEQEQNLRKMQNLYDDGIINREEFQNLKNEILGS